MHTLGFTSRRRVGAILELLEGRGELLKVTGKKYRRRTIEPLLGQLKSSEKG